MSDDAVLHFLPWMRRGIARSLVGAADANGIPSTALATIDASVTSSGTEVKRSMRVQGPGAVIGLASSQVVREDPSDGSTDFETSYFAAIELVSPDLPWMFTPAAANADKLIPWLVLVVVEDRDGVTLTNAGAGPLPVLHVDDATKELPDLRDAWAWAHVQSSVAIDGDVDAAFASKPEAFVARLVCTRRLAAGTYYRACLVPAFEQGRRAGLALDLNADDVSLAWTTTTAAIDLPVYHASRFRTAEEGGDFESLVKALEARTLDGTVGVHDLDVGEPGTSRLPEMPGTIVGFVGALVSPNLEAPAWPSAHQAAFQPAMQTLLNETLTASASTGAYDWRKDDPIVAPPAYGALAAGVDEVPSPSTPASDAAPSWLSGVNLDPAQRAAAGLGAEVVRRNQETLVASAWDQAEGVGSVNRVLNRSRLALEVGKRTKARLDAWEDGALLQVSRGAHARLKQPGSSVTIHGQLVDSALPNGLVSGALRRRLRPGTTVARAVASSATPTLSTATLASGVTQAFVADPTAMVAYAAFMVPYGTVFTDATSATATATARKAAVAPARSATMASAPAHVQVMAAGPHVVSSVPVGVVTVTAGAVSLTDVASVVRARLDPTLLMAARVRAIVTAPAAAWTSDVPASVWADPTLDNPMYALLVKIDPDLLMPGASDVPDNTVALAKVNAAFVESFLLGANDALSRELIWREYPADPAGTWLRTFWDSAGATTDAGTPVEDIPRVAEWTPGALGTHQLAVDVDKLLVLVVKGELLRRYPNTLVYAVPAVWHEDTTAAVWERVEDTSATAEQPIFVGALGSDTVFLGFQFDVDVTAVKGSPVRADGAPGWFFVFEQPPTEPRFGLDVGRENQAGDKPRYWKNVSWFHALGDAASTATHAPLSVLAGTERHYDDQGANTWRETWGRDAAAMARITLQRPVRMLVHADQMLEPEEA